MLRITEKIFALFDIKILDIKTSRQANTYNIFAEMWSGESSKPCCRKGAPKLLCTELGRNEAEQIAVSVFLTLK